MSLAMTALGLALALAAPRQAAPRQEELQRQQVVPVAPRRLVDQGLSIATEPSAKGSELPSDEELRRREIAPSSLALIAKLDSQLYAERRAAAESLTTDAVPIADILAALARDTLSAEQRHRLLAIVTDRIVNAPRGALGIRMDQQRIGEEGVRVTAVVAGLPAEGKLQPDDVIVAIEGRAIRDSADLLLRVQSLAPGTPIRLEVIRADRDQRGKPKLDAQGQPVAKRAEMVIELGSTRDLDRADGGRTPQPFNPAASQRLETARAIARRFPPPVRVVRLPSDPAADEAFAKRDADQHDAVRRCRDVVEAARLEGRAPDPMAMQAIRAQVRHFRSMASDPAYPEGERAWYTRVAERMEGLIAPWN